MAKPKPVRQRHGTSGPDTAMTTGVGRGWLLAIFTTALAYRGLCFAVVGDHPLLRYPVVDAHYHDNQARRMAAGDWMGHGPDDVFKPPLYPAYVALHYRVFGRHIWLLQWSQFLLGALSSVLLALLAGRFMGPGAGRVAGLLAALYPPFVFFELQLLTPALTLFLNAAALFVLFCVARDSRARLICAGVLFGLSAGVRPDVLLPMLMILIYMVHTCRDLLWRQRMVRVGSVLAGVALVVVPITIRNACLTREFIPISSNAGINLYTGNSAQADGISAVPVGLKWERLVCRVPQAILEKPAQASRWWVRAAWSEMRTEPKATVRRVARKALAFVNRREFRNNIGYHFLCRDAWPLGAWPLQLGVVLPLGACGLTWLARSVHADRRCIAGLCGLWIAGYWIAGLVFFVTARFRIPAVPFLILPAAFAPVHIRKLVAQRRLPELAKGGVVLAVTGLACWPWWLGRPDEKWSRDYFNLCNSRSAAGDHAGARQACDRAVELVPDDPDPHHLLASLLMTTHPQEALEHLQTAGRHLPDTPSLLLAMGQAHLKLGDPNAARDVLAQLPALDGKLNLWPKRDAWALAHLHLADLEPEQAQRHWDRAWSIDPRTAAEAAFVQGREPTRALDVFRSEARDKPWDWYSQANLGIALLREGRAREAVTVLRRAAGLAPDRDGLAFRLAQALAQTGHRDEALRILDRLTERLPGGGLMEQVTALRGELRGTR